MLTVEALSVVYEQAGSVVRAVDGVSFSIEAGEIFALVGESGSGKSSVALALTRLLPSDRCRLEGRVVLDGTDLLQVPEAALREIRSGRISYVFQDPGASLNPVLTIGEQLLETITLHTAARGAEAKRLAVEWLERVGMASARERFGAYPHEFSVGMQQRVCLAMGLAARAAVLVADEPTTALDVTTQVQILRLLRSLQQALRLTVLLVSHDLTVVERIAHRIGVMRAGRLVECGATSQVLRAPAHPDTKELLRWRSTMRRQPGPPQPPDGSRHG